MNIIRRAALLLAIAAAAPAAACPVTDAYAAVERVARDTFDQPPQAQVAAFNAQVVAAYPQLFANGVIGLDAGPALDQFVPRIVAGATGPAPAAMRRALVAALADAEPAFRAAFPDFRCDFPVYLTVSLGRFDGNSQLIAGRPALAFGVDTAALLHRPQGIRPLVFHELFHRHHAALTGLGDGDNPPIWESLWTEGLATYASGRMNPASPPRDIYLQDDLADMPAARTAQVAQALLDAFDTRDPRTSALFFATGVKAATDRGWPQRSGYRVGALVAADLARTRSLAELARLKPPELLPLLRASLRRLAAG